MTCGMLLQPLSEVALSLPAIVFHPESAVTIGRGADGVGRLPQTWLQVSSKHCAIRYDSDKVCLSFVRSIRFVPLFLQAGVVRPLLGLAYPEQPGGHSPGRVDLRFV